LKASSQPLEALKAPSPRPISCDTSRATSLMVRSPRKPPERDFSLHLRTTSLSSCGNLPPRCLMTLAALAVGEMESHLSRYFKILETDDRSIPHCTAISSCVDLGWAAAYSQILRRSRLLSLDCRRDVLGGGLPETVEVDRERAWI